LKLCEAISRRGERGILDLLLISAESDYTLTSAQVSESLEQKESRSRNPDRDYASTLQSLLLNWTRFSVMKALVDDGLHPLISIVGDFALTRAKLTHLCT
jgi:hypothetical protein